MTTTTKKTNFTKRYVGEVTVYLKEPTINYAEQPVITKPEDAVKYLKDIWPNTIHTIESACIIFLNRTNRIIGHQIVSNGGVAKTVVEIKYILLGAISMCASNIIFAHNHPSGNCQPSQEDLHITEKLKNAALLIDINLLDSIIITHDKSYSIENGSII